jgi:hypothetical protein
VHVHFDAPSGPSLPTLPAQRFRLDVPLHELLQKDPSPTPARAEHEPRTSLALPSPVFPQHPALLHEIDAAEPRLQNMKGFTRGVGEHWGCRAGQNWLIVRTNGTLAPCFPLYNATYDWGTVGNEKFDVKQLTEMKKGCEPNCFSTLGYNVA